MSCVRLCLLLLLTAFGLSADEPITRPRFLAEFGPVTNATEAAATCRLALEQLTRDGGGILILPVGTPQGWEAENISQEAWREPAPPAPTTRWGAGAGVTIIDYRQGHPKVTVPQLSGLQLARIYSLPPGQSSPHWEMHPLLNLKNTVLRGSTSYREPLVDAVEPGENQRFYVRTLRGLFPGIFLNTGDAGRINRLYVRELGFDAVRGLPYFTADVTIPVNEGSYVHNKTHVNALRIETNAHTEEQTFDVMNWRRQYSQGDSYMYDARFMYMSDVHSTGGDENGVLYAAFVVGESNIFRGKVRIYDPERRELVYEAAANAHTLGSGRPIINLNPAKTISEGSCYILSPGGALLGWGGQIRSTDAPWGPELVGRWFAVDEPTEYVPGGRQVRRWWYITTFAENDGVKSLSIQRHWWGAKDKGSISRLYLPEHFSSDEKEPRLLRYIIAPGANLLDVSRGVRPGPEHSGGAAERLLVLSPAPHDGGEFDFAPGDPIEQAIGPDPFRPIPFRTWLFENVPGAFPAPVFDIANMGAIARDTVFSVRGGAGSLVECETRADRSPPWGDILRIDSAARRGLIFNADIQTAILFTQPNERTQPMQWRHSGNQRTELTVSPTDGVMRISGSGLEVAGGIRQAGGLSGEATPARNLRGKNLLIPAGAVEFTVTFPRPEADADYALFLEQSWLGNRAIREQAATGFTVIFDQPAPPNARLHWMLVR